jgi:hypothetical protein
MATAKYLPITDERSLSRWGFSQSLSLFRHGEPDYAR